MLEYTGKYGHAEVFVDKIDSETVKQIYEFLNHEAFTEQIRIMPDTHAGKGAVIGFTMPMTEKVIPNVVGVDVGCGMTSMNIGKAGLFGHGLTREDFDDIVREKIPFSTNVRSKEYINLRSNEAFYKNINDALTSFVTLYNRKFGTDYKIDVFHWLSFARLCDKVGIDYERAALSLGTLGGGNHFIEVGKGKESGDMWITIHSGSRQFGLKIAVHHQRKAGKGQLAYLEGKEAFDYLVDMVIAQCYAMENRKQMEWTIKEAFEINNYWRVISVHNYIDFNDFIIRKGAISSYEKQMMIIPFNMEDGILLCEGKSNPDWNYSAPHGAGRVGSRKWAKANLDHKAAAKSMKDKGIYASVLPKDELKGAYKDSKIIEDAIEPTAKIIDRIKPILNMKAGK